MKNIKLKQIETNNNRLEEGKKALKEFKPNIMDVQTYNKVFLPQWTNASLFIRNLQPTLEGKCDKESLRQLQIIGWNEKTKKFISDVLNLYKEKVVNELNSCNNYEPSNIKNCPICGKQSLSASNSYCRDHTNSDDTDKYRVEYDSVVCTEVNWETKEFYFTFEGKEYKYKQQGDISCNADTDHIRCVIEEFKENLMKKEENNMENYIVINGKKAELTEEQLKQLGIEVKKKRNNPFNDQSKVDNVFYHITSDGVRLNDDNDYNYNVDMITAANSFNDVIFARQLYLHELLNRKLLKYAWDNNAEDCEWNKDGADLHYYIYFDNIKGNFNVVANLYYRSQNIYFSKADVARQAIKDVIEPFIEEYPEFVW